MFGLLHQVEPNDDLARFYQAEGILADGGRHEDVKRVKADSALYYAYLYPRAGTNGVVQSVHGFGALWTMWEHSREQARWTEIQQIEGDQGSPGDGFG